jgi:hypothetical protein
MWVKIHCKLDGRKKRGRPRRTWKDGIYTAINERDLRMGEWNNRRHRKHGSRKASSDVLKPRNIRIKMKIMWAEIA